MASQEPVLALAVVILALVVGVLVLLLVRNTDTGVDPVHVKSAVSDAISEVGLDRTAGQIETHAGEMKQFHTDIEQMLSIPQHRGTFGERQLEVILSDQLPPEMYGTQEQVVDTLRPDAYIRSPEGVICIDSKFSLEEYERYLDADDSHERATMHKRNFARAVERQLEKIHTDYVRPEAGTTDFAFAFIPSESVYYHLISTEYDLLRDYTKKGVQVVSPLTFGHKIELIKAGVQAKRLSEQAEEIQAHLHQLRTQFDAFEDEWDTFQHHFTNANNRAADADEAYDRLRSAFNRIEDPAFEDAPQSQNSDP